MRNKFALNYNLSRVSALQIFQLLRYTTLILIGVVYSKSLLTTAEIGQYEAFVFLAGAVSFFWLNGLIQGFLPSFDKRSCATRSPDLFNIFYLLLIFSVLAAIFILIFGHSMAKLLPRFSDIPFTNYLIIYLLLSSPAGLVEYIYLSKDQSKGILVYGFVSYPLMFLLVIVPPLLGYGIEGGLAGLVASSAFRFIWLLVLLSANSSPKPLPDFMLKHLKNASPLIFSMLLSGSAQYIDGFIISQHFDEAAFAVFRFGAREFPLVLLLANAFNSSMLPGFSINTQLAGRLNTIRKNSEKLAAWLFPLSGLMMLVSHSAFPVIFNVGFSGSATIFNIYLLLITSRLLFPQTILMGLQKNRAILWASFLEIIINVVLSLWFLQLWGLPGVAYGTVCAYLFEKLVLIVFVRRTCGIKVAEYTNVRQHLFYSLLLLALFIIVEWSAL